MSNPSNERLIGKDRDLDGTTVTTLSDSGELRQPLTVAPAPLGVASAITSTHHIAMAPAANQQPARLLPINDSSAETSSPEKKKKKKKKRKQRDRERSEEENGGPASMAISNPAYDGFSQ